MSNMLDEAMKLAVEAHSGQVDKVGQPYILHPLRVMMAMNTEEEKIVAVLHDVVEDGPFTDISDIMPRLFGPEISEAVYALTRKDDETYPQFIQRVKANELARRVKIADIKDNLRPGAPHLVARYEAALKELESE